MSFRWKSGGQVDHYYKEQRKRESDTEVMDGLSKWFWIMNYRALLERENRWERFWGMGPRNLGNTLHGENYDKMTLKCLRCFITY